MKSNRLRGEIFEFEPVCVLCSGGYTWSELWYLADRQPEIQHYTAECAQALVSDPSTGAMYWAHPVRAKRGDCWRDNRLLLLLYLVSPTSSVLHGTELGGLAFKKDLRKKAFSTLICTCPHS